MLPSPSELRELSERIREAVPKAGTERMKELLARDALHLAEVAAQIEQKIATVDPLLRRANIERYQRLLAAVAGNRARNRGSGSPPSPERVDR